MRADVKLGVVVSAGMVLIAGGYYLWRSPSDAPIGLADAAPGSIQTEATKPETKRPAPRTATPNQRTALRDGSAANTPRGTVNPNDRVRGGAAGAAVPGATPNMGRSVTERDGRPGGESIADDPTARQAASNAPERRGPANRPTLTPPVALRDRTHAVERSSEARSAEAAPASGAEAPAPGQPASSSPDQGDASRLASATRPTNSQPADASTAPSATRALRTLAAETRDSAVPVPTAVEAHIVQPGDSFAALARKYYGSERFTDFLVKSNLQVSDPSRLRIGETVRIPPRPVELVAGAETPVDASEAARRGSTSAPKPSPAARGRTYRVREGDSFYAIAREQLGDASRWTELLELNKSLVNGDPTTLRVGQEIALPAK